MPSQSTLNTSKIVFQLSKTVQPFGSKNNPFSEIKSKKRKNDKKRTTPPAKRVRLSSEVDQSSKSDSEQSDKENKPPTYEAPQRLRKMRRGHQTRPCRLLDPSRLFSYSSGDTTPVNKQAGSQVDQADEAEPAKPSQVELNVHRALPCVLANLDKTQHGTPQPSKAHVSNAVKSPHQQDSTASLDDTIARLKNQCMEEYCQLLEDDQDQFLNQN